MLFLAFTVRLETEDTYFNLCSFALLLLYFSHAAFQMLEENKTSDDLLFPVPWASELSQSFVTGPKEYLRAASLAGLELAVKPISRREEGQAFVQNVPPTGPPPLSLPKVTFGLNGMLKMKNILRLFKSETIFPCEMIFKKRSDEELAS
jgi:hypothetical protein